VLDSQLAEKPVQLAAARHVGVAHHAQDVELDPLFSQELGRFHHLRPCAMTGLIEAVTVVRVLRAI
jgi:hypothetical protein